MDPFPSRNEGVGITRDADSASPRTADMAGSESPIRYCASKAPVNCRVGQPAGHQSVRAAYLQAPCRVGQPAGTRVCLRPTARTI